MSDIAIPVGGHGSEHAHSHPKFLQHHFHTPEQQFEASKLGMWLFLVTEILLFSGLFLGYFILQSKHPQAFIEAHHHLDRNLGLINTIVLLVSSFTMVMAVQSAALSKTKATLGFLYTTFTLGGVFMVIKYFEYSHKIHDGLLPGSLFSYAGAQVPGEYLFFSMYFMMTGVHGIHILAGMAVIGYLIFRTHKGDYSSSYYTPVDLTGLYWHLVDLIWIYLFPLLYLVS
jgi:cytochrome c oxidase subunit III